MGLIRRFRERRLDRLVEEGFNKLNSIDDIAIDPTKLSSHREYGQLPNLLFHRFDDLPGVEYDIQMFLGECQFHQYLERMSWRTRGAESLVKLAYIAFVVWKGIGEYIIDRTEDADEGKIKSSIRPDTTFSSLELDYVDLSPLIAEKYASYKIFDGHLQSNQRDSVKTVKEMIKIYARNERLINKFIWF